jgi:hypothetical protein
MTEGAVKPSRAEYYRCRRELARQVVELYSEGKGIAEIAAELGLTENRAGGAPGLRNHGGSGPS